MQVQEFEVVEVVEGGVEVFELEAVAEEGRHGAGQGEEDGVWDWWDDVLLGGDGWDVRVADFEGASEEVECFGCLGWCAGVETSFGVCGTGEGTVYDAPFVVDEDGVPPMVGTRYVIEVDDFAGRLEVAADDFGVETDCSAQLHDEDCDLFRAASTHLDHPSRVYLSFEVFLPCDPFTTPCEDCSEPLDIASVRSTDISLSEAGWICHWR